MYNGIGLQTVRGTGTSGYVQTNKFNLNRRPAAKFSQNQGDPGNLAGPTQTKANEGILEHNRKRDVEKKLLELEIELIDKGYGEEEIVEKLDIKRQELLAAVNDEAAKDRTVETHELAKRKADEMDKIRVAFGLDKEAKEGQAFDRDLQERLKTERIAEREAQKKAKAKEEKRRKKEAKKKEKERKKIAKKEAKQAAKAAALKAQEDKKKAEEKAQRDAERAKREAEAKAKRQRDLQARLGPKTDGRGSSRQDRPLESPPPKLDAAEDDRYAPDPAERYVPRDQTPERDFEELATSPEALKRPTSAQKSADTVPSSISPTPGVLRRSATPSPSPAKVADRKRPPPAREPSPERSGPHVSPPPRKRNRLDTASLSPVPLKETKPAAARRGQEQGRSADGSKRDTRIGEEVPERRRPEERRYARDSDRREADKYARTRDSGRHRERRDSARDVSPARRDRYTDEQRYRDRRDRDRGRSDYDRDRRDREDRKRDRDEPKGRQEARLVKADSPARRPTRDSEPAKRPKRRSVSPVLEKQRRDRSASPPPQQLPSARKAATSSDTGDSSSSNSSSSGGSSNSASSSGSDSSSGSSSSSRSSDSS